jgi:hypothetical protein
MGMVELPYSLVTPKDVYLSRRRFLAGASAALGFASGISFADTKLNAVKSAFSTAEKPTPYQDVTSYNNFYEFGTDKGDPARNAKKFRTTPWTVSIEGAAVGCALHASQAHADPIPHCGRADLIEMSGFGLNGLVRVLRENRFLESGVESSAVGQLQPEWITGHQPLTECDQAATLPRRLLDVRIHLRCLRSCREPAVRLGDAFGASMSIMDSSRTVRSNRSRHRLPCVSVPLRQK